MFLNKKYLFVYFLISGILLGLSWIPGLTFLIFLAFLPFFLGEKIVLDNPDFTKKRKFLFWYSYLTFFIWNLIATWWVSFASFGGAAMAIACNALLMSLTYYLFLLSTSKVTSPYRILLLIPFWVGFEYLHTDWDLSWTWLTLGNVFAFKLNWIQWYEYTGVTGGTVWILLFNAVFFLSLNATNQNNVRIRIINFSFLISVLIVPIIFSNLIFSKYISAKYSDSSKSGSNVNVLIVQPSYDPYIEKFEIPFHLQFEELRKIISVKLDSTTDYLVLPETYIPHQFLGDEIYENSIASHPYIKLFFDSLINKYPKLHIVTGADTHYQYEDGEKRQPTARKYSDSEKYFECFNSSVQFNGNGKISIYHKSKLVPGVEMMPFPKVFGLLAKLAIEMGGTSGSLGRQVEREVFEGPKGAKVGTAICYESVFGEHVAEYVRKGANLLFILTNDAWWQDTPGYKQHLAYACLRAIETRKYIARSANTGISCFINDRGEIINQTKWYEKASISLNVPLKNFSTFFVLHGDIIAKLLSILSILIMVVGLVFRFRK